MTKADIVTKISDRLGVERVETQAWCQWHE